MSRLHKKIASHLLRKKRVRAKVVGTADRPRVSISISNTHISAQVIDDTTHKTILAATTVGQKLKGSMTEKAAQIGKTLGANMKKAKVKQVVIDRNGRRYAGRLKAFTDALRNEGVEV
jgi:large subunit ribosomal protein L18